MAEVDEEATYVRHHQRKIAFLFSAMRHFAADLEAEGITVDYIRLDGERRAASFTEALGGALKRHRSSRVVVTEPANGAFWRRCADGRPSSACPSTSAPTTASCARATNSPTSPARGRRF